MLTNSFFELVTNKTELAKHWLLFTVATAYRHWRKVTRVTFSDASFVMSWFVFCFFFKEPLNGKTEQHEILWELPTCKITCGCQRFGKNNCTDVLPRKKLPSIVASYLKIHRSQCNAPLFSKWRCDKGLRHDSPPWGTWNRQIHRDIRTSRR